MVEFRNKKPGKFWEYIRQHTQRRGWGTDGFFWDIVKKFTDKNLGYIVFHYETLDNALADPHIFNPSARDAELRKEFIKGRFR
jgi:hypothetical protein